MKFKVLMFVLMVMALVVASSVNAVTTKGIYADQILEVVSGDFDYPSVSHLRDNFYGVAYQGSGDDGYLQIIEIEDDKIVDSNVDIWEFDTDYAKKPILVNFNETSGLSLIAYIDYYGGNSARPSPTIKSFQLDENGAIVTGITKTTISSSYDLFNNLDLIKTSDTTYLVAGFNHASYGFIEMSGGTLSSDSTFTRGVIYRFDVNNVNSGADMNLMKTGSTCKFIYKGPDSNGYYFSNPCTNTEMTSGGVTTHEGRTNDYGSVFDSALIYEIKAEMNEDETKIYTTFGETASKYPVINILNITNANSLYRERLNTDTSTFNTIDVIDQDNVLMSYNDGTYLLLKTFVIAANGSASLQYTKTLTNDAARSDFSVYDYDVSTTTTKLIGAYETSSGDAITLGVGTIPPPEPEDTQIILKDERTLDAFNMTDKTLTFYAHCEDNTDYQEVLTTTTTDVPVTCEYISFEIKVEYELASINYAYSRYYLRDISDTYNQFTLNSYLVDPYDTDYVSNEFVIDDLTESYINPRLFFDKNINGNDTQITASYLDLTNSMRAILMNGERYYVFLEADNYGKSSLGTYLAPAAGTTQTTSVLHMYDIGLIPTVNKLVDLVSYQVYGNEDHQISYLVETVDGGDNNLINMTLTLYNGTVASGTVIYTTSSGGEYDPDNLYGEFSAGDINMSAYVNNTINAKLHFFFVDSNNTVIQKVYTPTMWSYNKITLPLMEYVSTGFMDWFFIILLSIIAVFATIKTADVVAMAIIGLASVFAMFGWFTLGSGALALAALVALINWMSNSVGGEQ